MVGEVANLEVLVVSGVLKIGTQTNAGLTRIVLGGVGFVELKGVRLSINRRVF